MPPTRMTALAPTRLPVAVLMRAPARTHARNPFAALARTAPFAPAWLGLALPLLMLPLLASAQGPQLELPTFDNLQQKAISSVNLSIGSFMLGLAGNLVDDHDKEAAELKKTLLGLKSVQVRSFQFNSDNVYSQSDVEAVRSQLSGPGWNRLVQVRDRNKNEAVDVYLAMDNHTVTGVAIIVSDPRKFTILNVVGSVDLDQIAKLRQTFEPGRPIGQPKDTQTP
jgi:hypothetical protein